MNGLALVTKGVISGGGITIRNVGNLGSIDVTVLYDEYNIVVNY